MEQRDGKDGPENPLSIRRVVVIGCCGAGKSTFAAELARRLDIPHIERDTLGELGSAAYRSAVANVVQTAHWVFDGPPYFEEDLVYTAAQAVIWLDYSRTLVLWRAVRRSLRRTFAAPSANQTGSQRLRQWVAPGGPRFACSVYAARQAEFGELQNRPELTGKVLRFGDPAAARSWLAALIASRTERLDFRRPG